MPETSDHPMTAQELSHAIGRAPTPEEQSELLWAMSAEQREQAMYRRELTLTQCCEWAARRPEEVPLLNGEFWFIAITTPEVAD